MQDIDMENYLNGNRLPKTQQEFLDYCNNGEYDVQDKITKERQKLATIYQSCSNEMEFYKKIINDYTHELVPIFLNEYSDSISNDIKTKIINLVDKGNVQVVTLDEAPSTQRDNKKGFAYCREHEKVFFSPYSINENTIERALQMKGTLIHEIHHIITNSKTEEPLVYEIEKENGEKEVTSISKSGTFFDEGLVEKSSLAFARKYDLFIMPSYRYSENVKFIDEVMAKSKISNVKNLFNKKYDDALSNSCFSQDFLVKYKNFEWQKTLKNVLKKENSNEKISKENGQDLQTLKKTLLNEKKDLLIEQKEKENQYKLVRKSGYINIVVLLIVLLVIVIFLMGR